MDNIDGKFAAWLIINHADWPLEINPVIQSAFSGRTLMYIIFYGHNCSIHISPDGLKWLENQGMIRRAS